MGTLSTFPVFVVSKWSLMVLMGLMPAYPDIDLKMKLKIKDTRLGVDRVKP